MLIYSLIVAALAWLNRVRGGGFGGQFLPGRALLWVSVAVGALALLTKSPLVAGALALGFLFWGLWPWGHLQVLGRLTAEQIGRPPSKLEAFLLKISGDRVHLAFGLRHLFVLPGLAGAVYLGAPLYLLLLGPIFAALTVAAYESMWRAVPHNPIWLGEMLAGALWGLVLVL